MRPTYEGTDAAADYARAVGRRLMDAINARGLYISEVSRGTGIAETTLRGALHGRHIPNLLLVARLCAFLELDANYVLGIRRQR